ncbi:aspartate aminotransferase family protein, partial [Streptomyces diastaticus]|nr:aspartate aminotransferase family protein [Streptomyces diastaticus]
MGLPPLASGPHGTDALRPLLDTVLDALRAGTAARGGPLPPGGPDAVAARVA